MKAKLELHFDDDLEVAEVLSFILGKIIENNPTGIEIADGESDGDKPESTGKADD